MKTSTVMCGAIRGSGGAPCGKPPDHEHVVGDEAHLPESFGGPESQPWVEIPLRPKGRPTGDAGWDRRAAEALRDRPRLPYQSRPDSGRPLTVEPVEPMLVNDREVPAVLVADRDGERIFTGGQAVELSAGIRRAVAGPYSPTAVPAGGGRPLQVRRLNDTTLIVAGEPYTRDNALTLAAALAAAAHASTYGPLATPDIKA